MVSRQSRMTQDRVIEKFALLPAEEWRRLAMQASWHYRTSGERPMPPKILAALGGKIPPREEWNALCKRVSAKKRALKYEERKHLLDQRRQRRRAYMRQYMPIWRANQKAKRDAIS
jgi:hypothetical protein